MPPAAVGRLPRSALAGWSTELAPALLGVRLVSELGGTRVAVRLTEVEAYMGEADPGSHAFRGRTPRTGIMFGEPGHLYVYFTYGMHWCANVVCGPAGSASAVLLRAGEIVDGLEVARSRRPKARADVDLARGPARLATALGIDGGSNGVDLVTDARLWLEPGDPVERAKTSVQSGPRVGIRGDGGDGERFPWRFWLGGDPTVSVYRPGQRRGRPAAGRAIVPEARTTRASTGEDQT